MKQEKRLIALAGQPNCGKSTVFNGLTGASQHVANYPGVTVDKMTGWYKHDGIKHEVVDLPGTYSLTSYSPEERVARDFILREKPSVVVNVMDASNLKRCLYLTFQVMEMDIPMILNLNMMDVVAHRGIHIDEEALSRKLGMPVIPTTMKTGKGKKELLKAIDQESQQETRRPAFRVDYGPMEPLLEELVEGLCSKTALDADYPLRWLAIKLLEGDSDVQERVAQAHPLGDAFLQEVEDKRKAFEAQEGVASEMHVAHSRYRAADEIFSACATAPAEPRVSLTDRVDQVVCNKFLGPLFLVGIIWLLYYLAIVQGYNLTNYTWPLLAKIRSVTEAITPAPGFIEIPLIRAFSLWFVDSVNALLNYIPIFFILFGLIAILEDSGYMPRMAFIMDRLLHRFGLHGQSTLPMVLGGIYVGGCAVPGVMATKGIPDARSRFATILVIPMLNCLAKVPLYVLLINIYFPSNKGLAMFFVSTVSLLLVLPIAKILTMTVLKEKESAPFVMEMPPYHLPTIRGVLGRAIERVWLFVRKITTIVAAVAVVIFALLQFPGISEERMAMYNAKKDKAIAQFAKQIKTTSYAQMLQGDGLVAMLNYWDDYKSARMSAGGGDAAKALNAQFKEKNPDFFRIVRRSGADGKKVNRAAKKLIKVRKKLLMAMRKERINTSFLGRMGKSLEPVTQWAGFNWRVNVALLSALAAKESSVATLGALYQQEEDGGKTLEQRMGSQEEGFTPLHALALILFMVLYPPCIATAIAVKLQTGSAKWMVFAMTYPMILGLGVAVLVFSGGMMLGLTGLQAMFAFYGLALLFTLIMGFVNPKKEDESLEGDIDSSAETV
ncbi:MAG: ferrous iron transport protein B [Deltaproteobacteria bacterium]|nr:MAG: ferrous iron transport protein B [Deltaproteobacteria bacterium]